jgi:DNA-directed RNA polymerase specialized sigma subunit
MTNSPVTVPVETITAAQAGDRDAMWQVVSACDGVLMGIVRAVAPRADKDDVSDLHQEARAALIMRLRDYDTDSSAVLSTFMYAGVRRAVVEEWIRMSTAHTVDPTTVLRVRRALATNSGDVERAWMSLAEHADSRKVMSRETFVSVLEALAGTESLDSATSGPTGESGSGTTLADTIPDPIDAENDADRRDVARWLMTQIPPRQAYALKAFYGVGTTQLSDVDAADALGVKAGALRRLRDAGGHSARRVADAHDLDLGRRYQAPSVSAVA